MVYTSNNITVDNFVQKFSKEKFKNILEVAGNLNKKYFKLKRLEKWQMTYFLSKNYKFKNIMYDQ